MDRKGLKLFMDVSGSQKIKASRQHVFQAILNPEVLKNSIPGCESAEFVNFPTGQQLKVKVSPGIPGFKGPYRVFLQTGEVVPPSRVVIIATPSNTSMGSIKATCAIDLLEDLSGTTVNYNANAELDGKVAAIPDFMLKQAVKSALDQFFKNFEKQVS